MCRICLPYTSDFIGKILSLRLPARMCVCMHLWMWVFAQWNAAVSVEGVCSALSFVLGTHSHFISYGIRLPDHHTSVTTHSVLSAVPQTCQVHLYSSILRTVIPMGFADLLWRRFDTEAYIHSSQGLMFYITVIRQRRRWERLWCAGILSASITGIDPKWFSNRVLQNEWGLKTEIDSVTKS